MDCQQYGKSPGIVSRAGAFLKNQEYPGQVFIYWRKEDRRMEKSILGLFPAGRRAFWARTAERQEEIQEIRLRAFQPVSVNLRGREFFLGEDGSFTEAPQKAVRASSQEIAEILKHVCRYSTYAYEDELRQGYITVDGGHRIGIAGQAVREENGSVRMIRNISFLNIRVAHEIRGAADCVLRGMYRNGSLRSALIISPPGCGKTTLLRDLIRQVSDGNRYGAGMAVGVVDERSELAGCFNGVPQLDVGMRTDVMDGCPKLVGMMMLLRAMSPQVLAIDELGSMEEFNCLKSAAFSGCHVLATVHGENLEDVEKRFGVERKIWGQLFERCLVLSGKPGSGRTGVRELELYETGDRQ